MGTWAVRLRQIAGAVSGQGVLAVGVVLILTLVAAALVTGPSDPVADTAAAAAQMPAAVMPAALPGLTPFTAATPLQFGGRITEVASIGNDMGWGQVHIWIDDGTGAVREISLAPQTYLARVGCVAETGRRINGTAFQFDAARPDAELYAKTITLGGQRCRLRDDEGLALWLNGGQ